MPSPYKLLRTIILGILALQGGSAISGAAARKDPCYGFHFDRDIGGVSSHSYSSDEMSAIVKQVGSSCIYRAGGQLIQKVTGSLNRVDEPEPGKAYSAAIVVGETEVGLSFIDANAKRESAETIMAITRGKEGTHVHVRNGRKLNPNCQTFVFCNPTNNLIFSPAKNIEEKLEEASLSPYFRHVFFSRVTDKSESRDEAQEAPAVTTVGKINSSRLEL